MDAQNDTTLSELMLAAEYADQMAKIHHAGCRNRGKLIDCASCDWHEDRVWKTDRALSHYWASRQDGAA